jgi:hypothetical protein
MSGFPFILNGIMKSPAGVEQWANGIKDSGWSKRLPEIEGFE